MKFAEQIERLQYLDKLIQSRSTGSPSELAERLGISRSQIYNLIGYINDVGVEVRFSRKQNSFYYASATEKLEIHFSVKVICKNGVQKVHGSGYNEVDNNKPAIPYNNTNWVFFTGYNTMFLDY